MILASRVKNLFRQVASCTGPSVRGDSVAGQFVIIVVIVNLIHTAFGAVGHVFSREGHLSHFVCVHDGDSHRAHLRLLRVRGVCWSVWSVDVSGLRAAR